MDIELEKLQKIAIEYFDIGDQNILVDNYKKLVFAYQKIKNLPCVTAYDEESLIRCLYLIAFDIARNEFFKTTVDNFGNTFDNYKEKVKPMDYIISDSLYRIYGDDSIISLSSEYREQKKLVLANIK